MKIRMAKIRDISLPKGLVGGPFGSSLVNNDYVDSGIPVIRGTNMSSGRYIGGEYAYVSRDKFDSDLSRNVAGAGDLVFTQRGTLGQVAMVPEGPFELYVVSQSQMRARINSEIANRDFVYYACTSQVFNRQIHDRAISTGVPHINLGILAELEVPLPDLADQQAIAEVLGTLDDKIAANAKLSRTISDYLAALFEESTAESDWIALGDVAAVNEKLVRPNAGGHLRYVDISSVTDGTISWPGRISWDGAPGRARRGLSEGDTIWSTVRPNRRSHALVLSDDPELVASTGLAVISPRSCGFAFLYQATDTLDFSSYLENVAEGSAYPAVKADRFLAAPIPWPEADVRNIFERVAAPLRRQQYALDVENQTLASTRDTLLPQLVSGKLRVKDAAIMAGTG